MCQRNQTFNHRLEALQQRIQLACSQSGRDPDRVRLLAVSKTRPAAQVSALAEQGQRSFGENYVDEAVEKIAALSAQALSWHFIGPIQSNKTRQIAENFDWVESVDREKIARRLADQRPSGSSPLNVLIQVNLDDEGQKAGCRPDQITDLAQFITQRPELQLRGLMAIPAPREHSDEQRKIFAQLKTLFDTLAQDYPGIDTISAGMSGDLEAAIAEGSTQIRVGTDLFGPRG